MSLKTLAWRWYVIGWKKKFKIFFVKKRRFVHKYKIILVHVKVSNAQKKKKKKKKKKEVS